MNSDHKDHTVTSTPIPHQHRINEIRAEKSNTRLRLLANYVYDEGFLPDIAATAAGYPDRTAAMRAARHAGRTELATALRLPTAEETMQNRIEDLEFCLDHGEHPDRAIARAGFLNGIDAAQNRLRASGRYDLAARLVAQDYMNAEPCYRPDCQRSDGHTGPHVSHVKAYA